MNPLPSPLLAVTDRHGGAHPLPETVAALLAGGGRWVWFRDRDLPADARLALGRQVAQAVRAGSGTLTVGGDIDLARALGAGGVHLGGGAGAAAVARARATLGPAALVGVSAHSRAEVEAAAAHGAHYVTLSPVFATPSKPGYGPALGPDGLAAATRAGIAVVALGGIGARNAGVCRDAGASGIAVMGDLMRAPDPAAAARALVKAWEMGASDAG